MRYQSEISSMMPIVSVVLPVFNAEKYVKEAVQSILDQTFPDFELIIINDGSTDSSLRILEQFKAQDERVILISRENKGLVHTLNEAISIARGQWIARMDADDVALTNRFARQLEWLDETDADICGSWVRLFGTVDERILKHPQTDAAIKMELLFGTPFAHPAVMLKTELVKKLRYDKAWEKCEDYDLWERASRAGWKMTNVPEVLLLYRQHDSQISTTAASYQQQLTQKIRCRYWYFIFDSMKLEIKWIEEVLKLREHLPLKPNMNDVDSAFNELLQRSSGEARATIFDHATRLYFRAAGGCLNTVIRWSAINSRFGKNSGFFNKITMLFLSLLRANPDGFIFIFLKKINMR